MARLPGWMAGKITVDEAGRVRMDIRIRMWHPGWWWFIGRALATALWEKITRREDKKCQHGHQHCHKQDF